jgi:hypothetical protein
LAGRVNQHWWARRDGIADAVLRYRRAVRTNRIEDAGLANGRAETACGVEHRLGVRLRATHTSEVGRAIGAADQYDAILSYCCWFGLGRDWNRRRRWCSRLLHPAHSGHAVLKGELLGDERLHARALLPCLVTGESTPGPVALQRAFRIEPVYPIPRLLRCARGGKYRYKSGPQCHQIGFVMPHTGPVCYGHVRVSDVPTSEQPNDTRVRGAGPPRKPLLQLKACKAPYPLQPIVRPVRCASHTPMIHASASPVP